MIYFLFALWALILIVPLVGLTPRVQWNAKRTVNDLTHIEITPAVIVRESGQSFIGKYAQERVEHWLKWAFAVLCWIIAAVIAFQLIEHDVYAAAASVIGFFIGLILTKSTAFKRQMEFIGHTVEAVAAARDGWPLHQYLKAEAFRTWDNKHSYGALLGDMTLTNLESAMYRRIGVARALVALQSIPLRKAAAHA